MRPLKKILIIRFSSLGDILLASPLIRGLRTAFPEAQIDFAVKTEYSAVLRYNPYLSNIIELKEKEPAGRGAGSLPRRIFSEELESLKQTIRSTRYDAIIDIHNSLRSRYLRWRAGSRYVRTVNKRVLSRFALVNLKKNFYKSIVPVVDRYMETVKSFGVLNDGKGLEVFVPEDSSLLVTAMLSKFKLERFESVLGIAPTARHFTKQWLPERFVESGVEYARKRRTKILIFGAKAERDYCGDIAQMINARLSSATAENLAGSLSFLETAVAFDRCDCIIANDSALMHLSAARKRRLVAIFGSTVREFGFFPYGTESIVVENAGLQCRPCSHIGLAHCPEGHFRCMKDIQVEHVVKATDHLLATLS